MEHPARSASAGGIAFGRRRQRHGGSIIALRRTETVCQRVDDAARTPRGMTQCNNTNITSPRATGEAQPSKATYGFKVYESWKAKVG
jgi:hypothetical protein